MLNDFDRILLENIHQQEWKMSILRLNINFSVGLFGDGFSRRIWYWASHK